MASSLCRMFRRTPSSLASITSMPLRSGRSLPDLRWGRTGARSGLHTGQSATMHPDLAGRANQFFYYGALTDASDEHGHGTHVSGIIAGNGATGETDESGALYGLGVAPNANIIAQRIFDADGN